MNYIETLICAIIGAGAAYAIIKAAYEILGVLQNVVLTLPY